MSSADSSEPVIVVHDLVTHYGGRLVLDQVSLEVRRRETLVILGGSGCGKSTLLRSMVGLLAPVAGEVFYDGLSFWRADFLQQEKIMRRFGILYQGGALWSSMTLAENVALPLEQYTDLTPSQIREVVSLKLSLVGLAGFEEFYPSQISGGMRKRAGLARAIALDPDILFFDEPSAGLDPLSARRLDELILQLRDSLGTTVVVVTHELASIFAIGTNAIFLDAEAKTMIASGDPKRLLAESQDRRVIEFLTRGEKSMP